MTQGQSRATRSSLGRIPQHVGIIMDGNGRWARARGLPRAAGHRAGTEALREVLKASVELGIRVLSIYAFSTENWSRPPMEVAALMTILRGAISDELASLHENGVRIRHLGRCDLLPPDLVARIREAEALTARNDRLILNVALNYGGRADIVDAVKSLMLQGCAASEVSEEAISLRLSTGGLPDPDLIIRTAGEMRLSNFLLWQSAYAEFYSTSTLWPDFGREDLVKALDAYAQRQRRFGGLAGDA